MPIFEVRQNSLTPVSATSFEAERLTERGDIQRLLKDRIDYLEDGLMVLAEEFSDWADSSRRIDLLCLDREANLVVVELKRTFDGGYMELQALRYAAMVSAMTFDQAVDALARFRSANCNSNVADHDGARAEMLSFLNWSEPQEDSFAKKTRIVLASADFSKELTTSVMWLRDRDIDIRCVRLKPYRTQDGLLLLDMQQLIPLPEASDYQIRIGKKRAAEGRARSLRAEARQRFLAELLQRASTRTALHADVAASDRAWVGVGIDRSGIRLNYEVRNDSSSVYLWLSKRKEDFHKLRAQRRNIEAAFGKPLVWSDIQDQQGLWVGCIFDSGYDSPHDEWAAIQYRMIDAMIRLDQVFRPRVQALRP